MTRVAGAVLLLATLALASACGPYGLGPPSPEPAVVEGVARFSPCRPVERPGDPPCPPAAGVRLEFVPASGGSTVTTVTDAQGGYGVDLPAGTYDARVGAGGIKPRPVRFTVAAGERRLLDLVFDSGIR